MVQPESPGSPPSFVPSASRSLNFWPVLVAVDQLPKSLPVSVSPGSDDRLGGPLPVGKDCVQPLWPTPAALKVRGEMPVMVLWPLASVTANGSLASRVPLLL